MRYRNWPVSRKTQQVILQVTQRGPTCRVCLWTVRILVCAAYNLRIRRLLLFTVTATRSAFLTEPVENFNQTDWWWLFKIILYNKEGKTSLCHSTRCIMGQDLNHETLTRKTVKKNPQISTLWASRLFWFCHTGTPYEMTHLVAALLLIVHNKLGS